MKTSAQEARAHQPMKEEIINSRRITIREAIRKKTLPGLWRNSSRLFHHDYAPVHTSLLVGDFLVKNNAVTSHALHIRQTCKIKESFKGPSFYKHR